MPARLERPFQIFKVKRAVVRVGEEMENGPVVP
jgi:hypothetical protein